MKPIHLSEDLVPVGKFKTQASKYLRRLAASGRPVVITQHGRPVGVVVPPAEYDRLAERERFIAAVEEGLADVEAGRTVSSAELSRELDKRFGKLR